MTNENGDIRKELRRAQDKLLETQFEHIDETFKVIAKGMDDARTDRKEIFTKLDKVGTDIATLKVKSGIWGAASGTMTAGGIMLAAYLKSMIGKP